MKKIDADKLIAGVVALTIEGMGLQEFVLVPRSDSPRMINAAFKRLIKQLRSQARYGVGGRQKRHRKRQRWVFTMPGRARTVWMGNGPPPHCNRHWKRVS